MQAECNRFPAPLESVSLGLPISYERTHVTGRTHGTSMTMIYKIVPETLWRRAEAEDVFRGAPVDLADGFIHFSTADQAEETARRHFAGQEGLLLAAFESEGLGDLRWEPSRGGALFPHLYGPLATAAARWVKPLPWDGTAHVFPEGWRA